MSIENEQNLIFQLYKMLFYPFILVSWYYMPQVTSIFLLFMIYWNHLMPVPGATCKFRLIYTPASLVLSQSPSVG